MAQRPDNVIQLSSEDRLYIFDAKYRLAFDDAYTKQYGGVGPKAEDVNTMHRYRDAIVVPHPVKPHTYMRGVVKSSIVLFPFADEKRYTSHKFFRSIEEVQIGGLPFLPGVTGLVEEQVRSILECEGVLPSASGALAESG